MKLKNMMFIISLIMIILLSVSFISATQNDTVLSDDAEDVLTSTEDALQTEETDEIISKSNENNLTSNVGTYDDLRNDLGDNNLVYLERDYAARQGDGRINIQDIEIHGSGHSIDAGGFTGIFQSVDTNDVSVTLIDLVLKNAKTDKGGAILVTGGENVRYTLINCTFINNKVTDGGGAIYFKTSGTLEISGSKFINNSISNKDRYIDGGGAIYLDGECGGINNTLFENNVAYPADGGAIFIGSGNKEGALIESCTFNNNRVLRDQYSHGRFGGAIDNVGKGNLIVRNSNFTNNAVTTPLGSDRTYMRDLQGGAINSDNRLELSGCYFENNSAFDQGGAVHADKLAWGENPCTFINNHVKTWNIASANKGGAIYASTFENAAKGHIFINNTGYYGGAIYINNKNDITFQSCYFEGNVAMTESKTQGSGAAIYVDSASSTVTMVDNIFYNNKATSDYGIFNCGKYGTVTHNWWGINNPNFSDGKYIMEWHRIGSNDKISDSNSLRITLSANQTSVYNSPVKLTLKFVCSDKTEFTGKLTNWAVDFNSSKGEFSDLQIGDNEATVIYTPEVGDNVVTAKVHGQQVSINLSRMGDFTWLQQQVDATPEGGVLNLTHNLTYNPNVDGDQLKLGIKITKPIVINGNGYTINGLNVARIFSIHSNDVKINNITFINGDYPFDDYSGVSGGAIFIDGVKNVNVSNSKFLNNKADCCGGAIAVRNGDNIQFINSHFISNTAAQAGAIKIMNSNVTIDGCEFRDNSATGFTSDSSYYGAGAIGNDRGNVTILNSIFLNNKAESYEIIENIADNKLTLTLVGLENYVNAIMSNKEIKFTNVTYWNGQITTEDNPVYSQNESGQNITLEIFNKDQKLVKKVMLMTDINGQVTYDFSNLENGNYTYKATHNDDEYYTTIWTEGDFNLTKVTHYPSSVKINITDGKEFKYGECNISFEITNRTTVDVLITNEDESLYFEVNDTNLDYVIADLPASDKEYYICVYNYANENFDASVDYKTFKILKVNSTVNIKPVSDVDYGENVAVSFEGDGTSYNVTVYNKTKDIVFSEVISGKSINITDLPAGEYNVTVVNLGNTNRTQSKASTTFNVNKVKNNFKVEVTDGVYGKDITVTVTADVDGDYIVYLNTRPVTVYVENGKGIKTIDDLATGNYNANVTFENTNYNNNATNTTFTIQKAQSTVKIVDLGENITWNTTKTIRFSDFYPVKYNVTIYDGGNNIKYSEITDSILFTVPILDAGLYNITVINLGNSNVTGSQDSVIFNVVNDNYVEVFAEDSDYGREVFLGILADVDGYYVINLNGTNVTIEVIDGLGVFNDVLDLNAGFYTTKVIFDNPDYNTIVNNTNFTVYTAESNLKIYEIGNVTYGGDINIKFYDDYPTTFYIEVIDKNDVSVFNTTFEYTDQRKDMIVIFAGLEVGEYMVAITNQGNENVAGNSSYMYFNVTELPGSIVASDLTRVYNSGLDFTARLVDENGTGIANKTITFIIKGKNYTAVTDANGVANINPKLAVGTYTVEVVNPFNNVKTTKTLKIVTRITGNKNVNTYYGKNYQYKLRIIGDDGKAVGAGIAVKVTINGKAKTLKTDKNGYITVKFTKNYLPKTYKVTAEYKGIKVSNKIKVKKVLKLKKAKVKRSAKKLKLKATLKEGKKALKGKKVVFKFKGKKYTAKTNKKGVAKVTIKKKVLKKLKKGKKVKYQVTYLKHTVKRTAKVKR